MADLISILDILNAKIIPLYVLVFLILGYFIWKVFYKKDKQGLSIYIDVALIAIILLAFSCLIILSYSLVSHLTDLYFGFKGIPQIVLDSLIYFGLSGIFLFVLFWKLIPRSERPKNYSIRYVTDILLQISILLVFPVLFLFSMLVITNSYVLLDTFLTFAILIIALFFFEFVFIILLLRGRINSKNIMTISFKKILIALLVISFVLFLTFYSPVQNMNPELNGYLVSYNDNNVPNYYEIIGISNKIRFSLLDSPVSILVINYPPFNLSGSNNFWSKPAWDDQFKVFLSNDNGSIIKEITKNLGELTGYSSGNEITSMSLDDNRSALLVKYNKEVLKSKQFNKIVFKTLHSINLSKEEFYYRDNTPYSDVCYGNGCAINIDITNNLSKQVVVSEALLFNFYNKNIINKSSCRFDGATYTLDKFYKGSINRCLGSQCTVDIIKPTVGEVIYVSFFIDPDNKIIVRNRATISKPLNLSLNIVLKC